MKGLENKTCIVTGGSNGIGKAICNRLLEEKCNVIILDVRKPDNLNDAQFYMCDLSSEKEIEATVAEINKNIQKVDVLINNAAIFIMKGIEATSEEWKKITQVNIVSVSILTKHLLPLIVNSHNGSIINIASISAIIGQANFAIYNATKAAILGLTKCWAIDLGKYNIRVNNILPGYIDSPSSKKYLVDKGLDEVLINRKLKAQHPLGRLGTPNDIANIVAFVASEEASFITGTDIIVDGGFTIQ